MLQYVVTEVFCFCSLEGEEGERVSEYKKRISEREKDDFWDIDKLVPKRRASLSPFASAEPTHTYGVNSVDTPRRAAEERKLTALATVTRKEDVTYVPEHHSLIKRVTIKHVNDKYDFYDSFRKSALLYFDCKGAKCEFAQFYSYMPQYSHMSVSQKNYYFYWREEMRHGRFIKTDYSYLYLYVYEILNLPDRIAPEEGIRLLCTVWREYRDKLPRIDLYFSVWVQDYCLVHSLPVPHSYISSFIYECMGATAFKEFYLSDIREVGFAGIEAILASLSDYDWRRGKFASGRAGDSVSSVITDDATYKKHMERAMYLLLSQIWDTHVLGGNDTAVITRNAFPNSLCTHTVKCALEIEYVSLSASEELRRSVTAAVRYTENKLRALLGVKSRLAVVGLPDSYKRVVDGYFETLFAEEQRRVREAQRPEYEKLYEAPREQLSFVGADEIERASWITTARLVEAEGEDEITPEPATVEPVLLDDPITEAYPQEASGPESEEIRYLAHLLGVGEEYTPPAGIPEEAIAEKINETFLDLIGDVVLEDMGEGYEIIEDYRKDVSEWLMKQG